MFRSMKQNLKYTVLIYLFLLAPLFIYGMPKDKTYEQAEKLFFQKKFDNAEALLKIISNKQPSHNKALSLMGDIYLFRKAYHKAIRAYERAVEVSSSPFVEYFRMGQAFLELQQFENAKDRFQRVYRLNPRIKTALFQTGYITLFHERNKQKTIEYWEQFITEAPNDLQYEKVKRVIELLRDPNFKIPPHGSDLSLKEALLLGAGALKTKSVSIEDKKAGDAKSKTNNSTKELLEDEEEL